MILNTMSNILSSMYKDDVLNNILLSDNAREEYSKILYNYKLGNRNISFDEQLQSKWLEVIEKYKKFKYIEDDNILTSDILHSKEFKDFLVDRCDVFSKNSKRRFVWTLTDMYEDTYKDLSARLIFILNKMNIMFKEIFEKDVSDKSQSPSWFNNNTFVELKPITDEILKYFECFDDLYRGRTDYDDVLNSSNLDEYFKIVTFEYIPSNNTINKIPFSSEYRTDIDNKVYDPIDRFVDLAINYKDSVFKENESDNSIITESLTIFHHMENDTKYRNSKLHDILLKILIIYYGIKEIVRENKLINLEFICNYFEHCIDNIEFEADESDPNKVSLLEYGVDFNKFNKTEHDVSVEAMDSGMDFGASQLKRNVYQSNNLAINKIDERYNKKFSKLKNIWTEIHDIKPSKLKTKINSVYFKKWYGRIPSMFTRYGSEATVTENRMRGDPTLILANSAPKYIANIVTETNKLFQNIIDMSKRIASVSDVQGKINIVKSWCTTYKIEDITDPKSIEKSIVNEITLRIAKCIFQNNDVYGYSAEGIVENGKFPSANHIVTSLFIENSNEEPQQQSVADIFSKPESITVYAHPNKLATFDELFKKTSNAIVQNFNQKLVNNVHENLETNFRNYSNSLRRKSDQIDGGEANDAENNKKIAKAIENGIVTGLDLAIDQKARCMQCVGAMYDMLVKVQKLAKLCVAALHEAEVRHSDNRMNTGVNDKLRNATNTRLNKINQQNNAGKYKDIKPGNYV